MKSSATAAMISLEIDPTRHSHLPLPFDRWHRSGFHRCETSMNHSLFVRSRLAFHRLNMPAVYPAIGGADSRYTVGAPCGLLTRMAYRRRTLGFVFLSKWSLAHRRSGYDSSDDAGDLVSRVIPIPAISNDRYPRCSGPPGVNSATFSARSSDIRGRPCNG